MYIRRVWAMPNKNTFEINTIKDLLEEYVEYETWLDPFARDSLLCCCSNDLNPDTRAVWHKEALDFLKMFDSVVGVLFDPPYSPRQIKESYEGVGVKVTKQHTQSSFYSKVKDQIALLPSKYVISFGWN